MKLWPQKKWKQILLSLFLALIVFFIIIVGYLAIALNRDVVSGIDVIGANGSKSALIVYQPGLSSFPKDVSYAFGNGLASNGWRVEITTASPQTPSGLSKYSLLVLAFPCYGSSPGAAIVRYVDRLGNLHSIDTVVIDCAAGSPGGSLEAMTQKIQATGGTLKQAITLFTLAPNEGNGSATEIAKEIGTKI